MKCTSCGREIKPDAKFCSHCGASIPQTMEREIPETKVTIRCQSCGKEMDVEEKFCSGCGALLQKEQDIVPSEELEEDYDTEDVDESKGEKNKQILLVIVLAVVVAILCGLFFYFLNVQQNEKKQEKEKIEQEQLAGQLLETESMEDAVDADAVAAEADAKEGAVPITPATGVDSKGYDTYESGTYYFQCKYPAWFQVLTDADSFFSCVSADGRGSMEIGCADTGGYTIQEHMKGYIAEVGGHVDYKAVGKDYFAVRTKDTSDYHYRYAKFRNGNIYQFSFAFPIDQFQEYDEMINDIYKDFIAQF